MNSLSILIKINFPKKWSIIYADASIIHVPSVPFYCFYATLKLLNIDIVPVVENCPTVKIKRGLCIADLLQGTSFAVGEIVEMSRR